MTWFTYCLYLKVSLSYASRLALDLSVSRDTFHVVSSIYSAGETACASASSRACGRYGRHRACQREQSRRQLSWAIAQAVAQAVVAGASARSRAGCYYGQQRGQSCVHRSQGQLTSCFFSGCAIVEVRYRLGLSVQYTYRNMSARQKSNTHTATSAGQKPNTRTTTCLHLQTETNYTLLNALQL